MAKIHKTAVIDKTAEIDDDVTIAAYSFIGPNVVIGAGTQVMPHVVIDEGTCMGQNNKLFQFSSVGAAPQDKEYEGQGAKLVIGDNNIIREYCTINAGADPQTTIGDDNWFMAYVHIAHDCNIGNHTVFVNSATLAGHVEVGDYANVGAFTKVHQFCRIGAHSFNREATITKDLMPYFLAVGNPVKLYGINKVGLRRHGFDQDLIEKLNHCYKLMSRMSVNKEYMPRLTEYARQYPEINVLIEFIRLSERGLYHPEPLID